MNICIRGFANSFLLLASLAVFSSVPALASDVGSDLQLPAGAGSGNIEDPAAAAAVLNEFCKQRVNASGKFSDEEAAQFRELLFGGQYSDKVPAAMREVPKEAMDSFVKEILRCAVTADTIRSMQGSEKKTKNSF